MQELIKMLILIIVILSIVNMIYKLRGYPTLLDISKEIFLEYIVTRIKPFRFKGFKAVVYYSYNDKFYHMRILLPEARRIDGTYRSLKVLRKQFEMAVQDYLLYESVG